MIGLGFSEFVAFFMSLDGFATKALRPQDFCFTSFYWDGKVTRVRFGLVFVSRKVAKALSFLLCS
ncbi:hypothetical protein RT99_19645 [Flavobacterium sp. MEB061]|nr:hypothetical protein RT99_19645 [Flavobacterium sp. MEB061]